MAMPPLQTRFQLWVARVQNARVGVRLLGRPEPLLDHRPADRRAVFGAQDVVQPVVADGEGVGHLGDVQEVRGVPVREGGGGQQLLAGTGRPAPVAVEAVEQGQRHHPVEDGPADSEQARTDQDALGGGLSQQARAVPQERVAEGAGGDVGGQGAADAGLVLGEQHQARMAEPQGREDGLAGDGGREGRAGPTWRRRAAVVPRRRRGGERRRDGGGGRRWSTSPAGAALTTGGVDAVGSAARSTAGRRRPGRRRGLASRWQPARPARPRPRATRPVSRPKLADIASVASPAWRTNARRVIRRSHTRVILAVRRVTV